MAKAILFEIANQFLATWNQPFRRCVCMGKRMGGKVSRTVNMRAFEGSSTHDLIQGREVIVTDNYGEFLFKLGRDLLKEQERALEAVNGRLH